MTTSESLPAVPSHTRLADAAAQVDVLIVPDETLVTAVEGCSDDSIHVTTPEAAVKSEPIGLQARLDAIIGEVQAPVPALIRALKRCILSWRYHGDPAALATTPLQEAVAESVRDADVPEATLASASQLEGSIACVSPEAFDPLQARLLPDDANIVTGDGPTRAHRRVGHSTTEVVTDALTHAGSIGYEQVAIIADGAVFTHVEAALAARSIPFSPTRHGDATNWQPFIELLEAAAAPGVPRIGDVKLVLSALGVSLEEHDDAQPLERLSDEAAIWLQTVTQDTADLTIDALYKQFGFRCETDPFDAIDPIGTLDIGDHRPTPATVRDLRAYLEVARETTEGATGGIQLLRAGRAWSTDRATTLFVGGGHEWFQETPPGGGNRWKTRESYRLAQLLASGDRRVLVSTERGDSAVASHWFEIESEESISTPNGPRHTDSFAFSAEGRPRSGHDRFTKTSLNRLLTAPRDALFSDVLPRPERRALTRGSAIHDYADLLLGAPTAADTIGREQIHEWIAQRLAPLVPNHRKPFIDTRLWAAIVVIDTYLEDLTPHPEALEGYESPSWVENTIANAFDIALERTITEQYFRDDELGISGVVDLIKSPSHLVDFKTGRPRPVADIVSHGRVPPTTRRVDTQLPLYLTALRRHRPEQPLRMTFVFCRGRLPAAVNGSPDIAALSRSISYRPRTTAASLDSADIIDRFAAAVPASHPRARLLSVLPREVVAEEIHAVLSDHDHHEVVAEIQQAGVAAGLDDRIAAAGARSVVAATAAYLETTLFADDLDRFERFLQTSREQRTRFDREGYPFGDPIESHLEFPDLHYDQAPVTGGDT